MIRQIATITDRFFTVGSNYMETLITKIMPSYDDRDNMWFEVMNKDQVLCSVPVSSVQVVAYFMDSEVSEEDA